MDHSLGDAIGGRPFVENTLGNEILDFFREPPVHVIIPTHLWGPVSVELTTADSAEMLPSGFGGRYMVGKLTLRNGGIAGYHTSPMGFHHLMARIGKATEIPFNVHAQARLRFQAAQ